MAAQRKRFQVQFEVSGDGKVSAAFVDVEQGARKAGDAVERGGKQADEAAQRHARLVKAATDAGKILGGALVLGITAAGTAAVSFTRQVANTGREIETFSTLANTAPETFQRWAAATSTVGIEQDKLADILKDMQDRVGDFLQTGGGPMADFFENIAPQVGVTAQQFARLSGPDALLLYVDTLQRANLHQNDMAFYMEALASDSTLLLPLLRDNGRALEELGDRAQRYGAILDDEAIAATREMKNRMDELHLVATGLRNEIALDLLPQMQELADLLMDPEFRAGFEALISGAVGATSALASLAVEGANVVKFLAEAAAARVHGPHGDDIVRIEDAIARQQRLLDELDQAGTGAERRNESPYAQRMRAELEALQAQADAYYANQERMAREAAANFAKYRGLPEDWGLNFNPNPTPRPTRATGGDAKSTRSAALSEEERAARALDRTYESMNARLLEQIALFGQTGEAARVRYEIESGALQNLERGKQIELQRNAALRDVLGYAEEAEQVMADNGRDLAQQAQDAFGEISLYAEQAGRNIQGHLADFLFDPFEDGLEGMVENFAKALQRMMAEMAASQLLDALGGWGTANAGQGGWEGALGSAIASLFGGGRAVGGPTSAGGIYRVAEHEPELLRSGGQTYLLMGGQDGHVVPPRAAGGAAVGAQPVSITVHNAPAPVARATATQGQDGLNIDVVFEQMQEGLAANYSQGVGPLYHAVKGRHGLEDAF